MKTKVVLEVEKTRDLSFPHNNDVILYDGSKKCWYQTTKDELLENERKEIVRQAEEIKKFKEDMSNNFEEQKRKLEENYENNNKKFEQDFLSYRKSINETVTKLLELVEPIVKKGGNL